MRTIFFTILLLAGAAFLAEDSQAAPQRPQEQLKAVDTSSSGALTPQSRGKYQRLHRWLRTQGQRGSQDGGGHTPTPGPLPLALLGLGSLGLGFGLRRRRRNKNKLA
ncbi:MAG: hypothetical protein CSA62_02780 [Planctomycetota bacterium]|nr:MAG: hypothetical protein CSA62_02780 [Planctomycetota bacterium]